MRERAEGDADAAAGALVRGILLTLWWAASCAFLEGWSDMDWALREVM